MICLGMTRTHNVRISETADRIVTLLIGADPKDVRSIHHIVSFFQRSSSADDSTTGASAMRIPVMGSS